MKKSVALLTTALLGASFVLGTTACDKKASSPFKEITVSETTTKITALTKENMPTSQVDEFGLMLFNKANKEENVVKSNTYQLFDVTTNAFVTGAEVTVDVTAPAPTAEALTVTEYTPIEQLEVEEYYYTEEVDGFYYSTKTVKTFTADNLIEPQEVKTTYTLYGKNGKIATDVEGEFVGYTFVAKDGARYYVDVNGNLVKEENVLAPILPYEYDFKQTGEYILLEDGMVFDKTGKYIRSVDFYVVFGIPENADEPATWTVGNYFFMQYAVALPETEDKYDFVDEDLVKYDLVTQRYDLETGKVKDFDMDFYVGDGYEDPSFKDGVAVIYGQEIKDERLMMADVVQLFDEDCDVALDVQKILPGAQDFEYILEDYFELRMNGITYIVEDDEIVFELVYDDAGIYGNMIILGDEDNAWVKVYGLDGTLKKTYTDVVDSSMGPMGFIIQTETSVVKYDALTETETTVCTFSKEARANIQEMGVYVIDPGANVESEEDDKYSLYFLVPGVENLLNLTKAEAMSYDVESVATYYSNSVDASTMGTIFMIAKTTGEGESATTEVTYYNYKKSGTME